MIAALRGEGAGGGVDYAHGGIRYVSSSTLPLDCLACR